MNYYTDDSPGLKLSPVGSGRSRDRQQPRQIAACGPWKLELVFCIIFLCAGTFAMA